VRHGDGWAVSTWFVEPHEWLAQHRPVDLLESNLPAILQAAGADHLVGGDDVACNPRPDPEPQKRR
jgi:uncharacterized protein (DUF2384 family)